MTNFSVNFTNAWWLLLLIPAFGLTLFSYFRLNKRYRFTRNRIVSIVLHLVIMVLSIALLAGLTFDYYRPNSETEVILLVDSTDTMQDDKRKTDEFIKDVVNGCDSKYKIGIVKFGYDQVYAVELTNKTDRVYSTYQTSDNPDTSATDVASALVYAESLFENRSAARIVLISDALETDGKANEIIKSFSAKGIAVDTVYFPEAEAKQEVQIVSAIPSVSKVEVGTQFNMNVTLNSSFAGAATITPYDNNEPGKPVDITLNGGPQTVNIPYSFPWGGMHVVSFKVECDGDGIEQNNTYCNHIYIETFSEVLVIESIQDESVPFVSMLSEELNVKVMNIADASLPKTLDELREYDEVVLLNVADSDLPKGFDKLLKDYVYTIGGGLFTICGNEKDSTDDDFTAHAYTRTDMYGTVYQEMLPVEIVEYTPPVGVVIIIDTSGSMLGSVYEKTNLYGAIEGSKACLDALTDRDYVGIMTLADEYTQELDMTPRTQRQTILDSLEKLEDSARKGTINSGGTLFSPALERAGRALGASSKFEKKHIIIVSDGEPSSNDEADYLYWAKENAKLGITMSIIGAGVETSPRKPEITMNMNELLVAAGCDTKNFHPIGDNVDDIPQIMRKDLETPEIKSINYEDFVPKITAYNSVTTNKVTQEGMPTLGGYYGVKLKEDATEVLRGTYSPLYAHWEYGKGRVGTFACNLNGGKWSGEFIESEMGKQLMNNIVKYLFPKENVRATDIGYNLSGDNYTTTLSIITNLKDDESIKVTVKDPESAEQVYDLNNATGYSRLNFATKLQGLYTITIQKLDKDGNEVTNPITAYKTLAYSKEYDAFSDKKAAKELMENIAIATKGFVVDNDDPEAVFENAVEYIHIVIDPRIVFAIIIIVCFLLDIAARKFKWKWPHEIIKDRKRAMEKRGAKGGIR